MGNNINEEIGYMKYLLGYKKGVIISEQVLNKKYDTQNPKLKQSDIFSRLQPKTDTNVIDEPKVQQTTTPTQTSTTKGQEIPTQKDETLLLNKKQELETELQNITKNLEIVGKQQEFEQKQKYIEQLNSRLELLDKKIEFNCSKGWHPFRGCRRYYKDQQKIREDIRKLMGIAEEPKDDTHKAKDPDYWQKWLILGTSLLALLGSVIGLSDKFKSGGTTGGTSFGN